MRSLALAAVLLCVCTPQALGNGRGDSGTPSASEFARGLGGTVGPLAGSGLSYRRWFGPIGVQVAGGALYFPPPADESEGPQLGFGDILNYSVGFQVMRSLYAVDVLPWMFAQLYGFAGLNHSGTIPWEWEDILDEEGLYVETLWSAGPYTPRIGVGAGIGVEVAVLAHLSWTIELGYAAFWMPTLSADPLQQFVIDLAPQTSFHFRY